jgi:D-tyrosyl-tRNA(Tyr) deacylase
MRAVIQRVKTASVVVNNETVGAIDKGLLIFLGVGQDDQKDDIDWLVRKISQLRIFSDIEGKMNKSLMDIEGSALVISQFTLLASTKKGNRPSFIHAAKPDLAIPLYETFIQEMKGLGIKTETGIFGADMAVQLTNDGPVTILIDTKNRE